MSLPLYSFKSATNFISRLEHTSLTKLSKNVSVTSHIGLRFQEIEKWLKF